MVPASGAVTLTTPGTYYWQASYSGDPTNDASTSTCGSEVETVTGTTPPVTTPVTVTTSLSAGGGGCSSTWGQSSSTRGNHQSWGGNGSGGTTTCGKGSRPVGDIHLGAHRHRGDRLGHPGRDQRGQRRGHGDLHRVLQRHLHHLGRHRRHGDGVRRRGPDLGAVTLTTPGTYYWQASYSGDTTNAASTSTCGSEVETVTRPHVPTPVTSHIAVGNGSGAAPHGASPRPPNTKLVATVPVAPPPAVREVASPGPRSRCPPALRSPTRPPWPALTWPARRDGDLHRVLQRHLLHLGRQRGDGDGVRWRGPDLGAVTLTTPGTYYWQASYSGTRPTPLPPAPAGPRWRRSPERPHRAHTGHGDDLSDGGSQSGASISVPTGTAVTDSATLAGTDVAHAGGTVTYTVYSNDTCSTSAGSGGR